MSSDGRDDKTDRTGARRRFDLGQVSVVLAMVAVVAIVILNVVRVPESRVAVSAQLNALIALTGRDAVRSKTSS